MCPFPESLKTVTVTWWRAELRLAPLPTVPQPDTTACWPPYWLPPCPGRQAGLMWASAVRFTGVASSNNSGVRA